MKLILKLALLVAILAIATNSGYLAEAVAQALTQAAVALIAILAVIALIVTYPIATIAVIAIVVTVEMTTDVGIVQVLDEVGVQMIEVRCKAPDDCTDNCNCNGSLNND